MPNKACLSDVIGADPTVCPCRSCHSARMRDNDGAGYVYCRSCRKVAGEYDNVWRERFRLYVAGWHPARSGDARTFCQCRTTDLAPLARQDWMFTYRGDIAGPSRITNACPAPIPVPERRLTGFDADRAARYTLPSTAPASWSDAGTVSYGRDYGSGRDVNRVRDSVPTATGYTDPDTGRRRSYTPSPPEASRQPLMGADGKPYRKPTPYVPGGLYRL